MIDQSTDFNFNKVDFNPFEDSKEIEKIVLINESQQEIWLSCMLGGDAASLAYNESVSLDLKGHFNFDYFRKAFNKVVKRHEALRSAISANGENLIIYQDFPFELELQDISSDSAAEQEALLHDFVKGEMIRVFDLQEGPLFRVYVHRLSESHHYFTFVIHHLVGDGWSIGIILEDLSKLYNAYLKGIMPVLSDGPQISSYAEEQAVFIQTEAFRKVENFWLNLYRDNVPVLDLPADYTRPATRSYQADRVDHPLPVELVNQLKQTGAKAGCSLVNTLLSAFEVFLYQQTGQRDIVVGLPTAGQSATENFELVGHCVNLLPLKSHINPDQSFYEYLKARKSAFFDAYEHQQLSFGQLLKKLNVKRDHSRIPLVPVVFNIDMGMDSAVSFDGLEHKLISNPRAFETFEIFLNATGSKDTFVLEWTYNTQIFKQSSIEKMTSDFESLLQSFARNPELEIKKIIPVDGQVVSGISIDSTVSGNTPTGASLYGSAPVVTNPERVPYPDKNLVQLIDEVAAQYPDRPAVSFQQETITYKQLVEKSNQLANFLIEKGIKAGDIVGLSTDRSMEMLISLLGILKAGGTYLPLDPEYPRERIGFMLEDSSASILLIAEKYTGKHKTDAEEFIIEKLWPQLNSYARKNPEYIASGDELAYILYTSGSTGRPKGVKITNRNLVNFLLSMQARPGISVSDRLLAITTISFDIAGLELYLPLISGAELIIADGETTRDGRLLLGIIEDKNVSIMQATPSTWQMMLDSGWQKKYPLKVLSGGEALPKVLADQLLLRSEALWNMYGPTETTIWSTIKQVLPADQVLSIGLPINNTLVYIVDEDGRAVPAGVAGEIYIGGDGVAEGYLNRADLTAEKFVKDKISGLPDSRLYRTGDLGKILENGEIQCLGRIDQQVKIRGHRIELGEIESLISAQEEVKQAVVVAREDTPSNKRLVAYVILNELDAEDRELAWKERWDTLYNIGAESKQNLDISEQHLDDTLLEHYENKEDLARQAAEWLQSSAERIKELGSKRIFEIGSGGGQLLFELAPDIEAYVATDYAQTAIVKLNEQLQAAPEKWSHVKAAVAAADDFTTVINTSFDLVLIHSVAQYFPNADYLISVIKESVRSLKEGGCIFIGDMQGKNSLEMCHAMDQLPHSSDAGSLGVFKEVISNRVRIEDELVADPGFFYALTKLIPEITNVDIQLRRGASINETTKYHYDVWLYVRQPHESVQLDLRLDWKDGIDISELEQLLSEKPGSVVEVKHILNSRTAKDHRLLELMKSAAPNTSLGVIKSEVAEVTSGSAPDLFWELAKRFNFNAHVRWTTDGTDGLFDVVFIPAAKGNALPPPPSPDHLKHDLRDFARLPFSKDELQLPKEVIQEWKETLHKSLPAYMVPEEFIALKSFPLTPNAKIDRNALPKPPSKKKSQGSESLLPMTKNELLIADIWSEALGLEDLKITDDFFELGGHSLLAVKIMVAIEKKTGKRLPLATLFENATIEKLAKQLSADEPEEIWDSLVPIKTTGTKTPLFLIHGGGLNILLFRSISEYFHEDQPVYGIQAFGLNKETTMPSSMEEIAARHIKEILAVSPEGPYSVAGYSLGGFIAYEIAKQLKAMGKEIKMFGVMDTYIGSHTLTATKSELLLKKIKRQFQKVPFFIGSFISHPKDAFAYQLQILGRKFRHLVSSDAGEEKSVFTPYELEIYKVYDKVHDAYVLTPFDVKVTLFRVEKRLYYLDDKVYLGWDKFALQGVEIHQVPGDHKTFLYPPNDEKFAAILQHALDHEK